MFDGSPPAVGRVVVPCATLLSARADDFHLLRWSEERRSSFRGAQKGDARHHDGVVGAAASSVDGAVFVALQRRRRRRRRITLPDSELDQQTIQLLRANVRLTVVVVVGSLERAVRLSKSSRVLRFGLSLSSLGRLPSGPDVHGQHLRDALSQISQRVLVRRVPSGGRSVELQLFGRHDVAQLLVGLYREADVPALV